MHMEFLGNYRFRHIRHIVLQPTTLCNLNCSYCYLPERQKAKYMDPTISLSVANSLKNLEHKVQILWHGGEPLATGLDKFYHLLLPFEGLRSQGLLSHSIQTNTTLVTGKWCQLLKEFNFHVGVSIDGNFQQSKNRTYWNGKSSYMDVIRGIQHLKDADIPFGVIAVVSTSNVDDPETFYNFFHELGCKSLSVNIEEQEGLNRENQIVEEEQVRKFWSRLFCAWLKRPDLSVREFDRVIGWLRIKSGAKVETKLRQSDLWPTISTKGNVVVVSPELMAAYPQEASQFIVGNVLEDQLPDIVNRSWNVWYVEQFRQGVALCHKQCPYFTYCGGGQASNKYYETGSLDVTETRHCRNTRQILVDAVLGELENEKRKGGDTYAVRCENPR
jgi:uncharacterized protein